MKLRYSDVLAGLKEISAYMGRDNRTVLKLIRLEGFPAKKIQGSWYAHRGCIQDWLRGKDSCQEAKLASNKYKEDTI